MPTQLSIDNMKVAVYIGTTDAEQAMTQTLELSVHIGFDDRPRACHNDRLMDTVPYDALCKHIKQCCSTKRFALIEAFAQAVYTDISKWLDAQANYDHLWLRVRKRPPLSDVDSTSFCIGDGHPHTWSS